MKRLRSFLSLLTSFMPAGAYWRLIGYRRRSSSCRYPGSVFCLVHGRTASGPGGSAVIFRFGYSFRTWHGCCAALKLCAIFLLDRPHLWLPWLFEPRILLPAHTFPREHTFFGI